MKSLALISGLALVTTAFAGGVAQAEVLSVNTTVAPYCNIRLANVSSGTASVAHEGEQMVANLQLACNTGGTTQLVVNPEHGDFKNGNHLINYAMRLAVAGQPLLSIAATDATPGDAEGSGLFTRSRTGYSQDLANGLSAEFFLDVNVAAGGPPPLGQTYYPANAAPAGTYNESFKFELSAL